MIVLHDTKQGCPTVGSPKAAYSCQMFNRKDENMKYSFEKKTSIGNVVLKKQVSRFFGLFYRNYTSFFLQFSKGRSLFII